MSGGATPPPPELWRAPDATKTSVPVAPKGDVRRCLRNIADDLEALGDTPSDPVAGRLAPTRLMRPFSTNLS